MASYQAAGISRPQHMQAFGNASIYDDSVTITANLTTADTVDLIRIPAGTRVTGIKFFSGDLDTSTTLTANIGWRSVSGAAITVAGSSAAANATAFGSALTMFQAASSVTSSPELGFAPVTFNDDVYLTLIPAVNGTGLSGTPAIVTIVDGVNVGVK